VQVLRLFWQITAASKETDLTIVVETSWEELLLAPSELKFLHVQEVGIATVTMMRVAPDQAVDILTERSRLVLPSQLQVSQPRQPPNMSRIAKQTRKRQAEAVHELEASRDVAILMTMTSTMRAVPEEAEADTPIPSIALLRWPRPVSPLRLLLV
jgi:hypothetical protein